MRGLGNQGAYDLRLVKDVLAEKDAQIERLKAEIKDQMSLIEDNNYLKQLVTELADALGRYKLLWDGHEELIQRAREVTKCQP